jgi:hypothetical protein
MNIKQKLRLLKVTMINLYWSLKSEQYALKLLADTSVGFYIRHNEPALYKEYYLLHAGYDEQVAKTIDSLFRE